MQIVGVKFGDNGKVYDFDAGVLKLRIDDRVVVQTERGIGLGIVVKKLNGGRISSSKKPLKKILRKANANDINKEVKNKEREEEIYKISLCEIGECKLPMKLVKVDRLSDGSKIIFYFTAESRVDFRELVKRLAHRFHTRIEMRQIGVRNETKMMGGIGNCGREFCCSTFLKEFEPVSVRIAKDQNMALNPAKISGVCGRLICCLTFEHEAYLDLKKNMPKCGKMVRVPQGRGKVIEQNIIRQSVIVRLEDGREVKVPVSEVKENKPPGKCRKKR